MKKAPAGTEDAIALLRQRRDAAQAIVTALTNLLVDLGAEAPDDPDDDRQEINEEEIVEETARRVTRKRTGWTKESRRPTVLEVAGALESPVTAPEMVKLLYSGTSKNQRRKWAGAVWNAVRDGVLEVDDDGLIYGVSE